MPKPKQVYRHLIIFSNGNSEENTVRLLPLTEPHHRYILHGPEGRTQISIAYPVLLEISVY